MQNSCRPRAERFDKFAWRPLPHILVLRGTGSSVNNANLVAAAKRKRPKGKNQGWFLTIPPPAIKSAVYSAQYHSETEAPEYRGFIFPHFFVKPLVDPIAANFFENTTGTPGLKLFFVDFYGSGNPQGM